jgi:SAM-dependent methyltransferase
MPGVEAENYWFRRHQAAYLSVATELARARRSATGIVLEVGSGEGYGAALLADEAADALVIALDYDAHAVRHAAATYPRLTVIQANLAALPVRTQSVDAVVSLQVIEHVWDHPQFVAECARVLRPGGLLALSTPNRLTFSPGLDRPLNPFHTHEFTAEELAGLVAHGGFQVTSMKGLFASPRLRSLDSLHRGGFEQRQLAAPPELWPAQLAADVASIDVEDFAVGDVADDCLDLLLLARAR